MRFFAFNSDNESYLAIRSQLDVVLGYPNKQAKTETCLPHPDECIHDADGRTLLAVENWMCNVQQVAAILPQLIRSGLLSEITNAEYRSALDAAFREAAGM